MKKKDGKERWKRRHEVKSYKKQKRLTLYDAHA